MKQAQIQDANGRKLAFVDGQGNLVDAKTGKKMGRMEKDAKSYYHINGELLYTIRDNADNGLRQHENGLEVYVMAEIPSNIISDLFPAYLIKVIPAIEPCQGTVAGKAAILGINYFWQRP